MHTPRGPRHSPYRGGYGGPSQGPPWRQPNWNGEYPARSPIPSPRSYGYPRGSPRHGPPMSSPRPSPRDNGQPMRNHTPSPRSLGCYSMPYDGQGSLNSPFQPNRSMPPRHSTPFANSSFREDQSYGSLPDFITPQSPGQSSANNSSYFTPPETPNTSGSSSFNSSILSGNSSYRGGRQSYDEGRGGQNRRQSGANQNHGGKRRKMDFERTLPGTLLKNSMLDSPWAGIVPTRCPFDGLVMSGGQRHSVLTPGKTAVAALAEENNDAFEGNEEKIDLTD